MQDPNALLKKAVSEITNYINTEKLAPHDAVKKVAKEMDLNVNFIKRASEVINVALTYNHFKKNANARDQDFPIVDADKVAAEVFKNEKKASASEFINVDDEIPNFNRFLNDPKFKKAFSEIANSSENYDSYPLSMRGAFDKTSAYLADLERIIDELKTKKAEAQDSINKSFFTLVGEFSKDAAYRSSFETFEKDAQALFGDRATPYIEFIHSLGASNEKRASEKGTATPDTACKEAKLFAKFVESIDDLHKISAELEQVESSYIEDKQKIQQAYFKLGESMLTDFEKVQEDIGGIKKKSEEEDSTPEVDPVREAMKAKLSEVNPIDEKRHLRRLLLLPRKVK
jgi:hypothetical protein